jgi:hypothetical protein
MIEDPASALRLARLGQMLLEVVPGAVLRVGTEGGPTLAVARPGDPRAEVLSCQHRAALVHGLGQGSSRRYVEALDLMGDGALTVELDLPAGVDLGTGLVVVDEAGHRRICAVTTLCPTHAAAAARAARTVPLPAHHLLAREQGLAELRLDLAHDRDLGVTLLAWVHRPHPAVVGPIEDVARAAAAAVAVEELLVSLR